MINMTPEVRGAELVEIRHPAFPDSQTTVSRRAFESRSRSLGWVLVEGRDDDPVEQTTVTAQPATATATAGGEDMKEQLQQRLDALGVPYDRRLGVGKLQALLDQTLAALNDDDFGDEADDTE